MKARAAVLALIAATLAGCSSGTSTTTAAPSFSLPAAPSITDTPAPTDTPAYAPPTAAAPTSAPADSMRSQIVAWYSAVSSDLDAITADQGDIATAGGNSDVAALTNACSSLKNHVQTFEGDPSAPDPQIRINMAAAMDHYSTAATQCLSGDYTASASEISAGTASIAKVTARIKSFI